MATNFISEQILQKQICKILEISSYQKNIFSCIQSLKAPKRISSQQIKYIPQSKNIQSMTDTKNTQKQILIMKAYFGINNLSNSILSIVYMLAFSLLMLPIDCKCQKGFIDLGNSQYNSCQMCYFQFSNSLYFLKCSQKRNCTKKIQNTFIDWQMFGYSDLNMVCQYESETNYDSFQCQQLCCEHFNSATRFDKAKKRQEILTIGYCQDKKNVKSKLVVLLVSLLTSPVSVLLFCLIACKCIKKNENEGTLAENFGKPQESFINENNIQLSSYNLQEHGPDKLDQNEACAVCLDDHCNIFTNCGHYYHATCLRQWLVKRPRCPVCVSKQYNPVKIYCVNCKKGAKMVLLQRTTLNEQQIKIVESLQNLTCEKCVKNPQRIFDQLQILSSGSKKQSQQRKKTFVQFQLHEQSCYSPIQRSFPVKKSHIHFQQQQQEGENQTERRLSSSLRDVKHQQKNKEKRKFSHFDGSIKQYIKSFKRQNKSDKNLQQNKNTKDLPNKNINKNEDSYQKQTPSKLISYQNSPNTIKHEQSQISSEFQVSLHFKQNNQQQKSQKK